MSFLEGKAGGGRVEQNKLTISVLYIQCKRYKGLS
jgi:hypothetical protein